jgi:hypothetical protein
VRKRRMIVMISNQASNRRLRRRRTRSLRKSRSRTRRAKSLKSLQVRSQVNRARTMIRSNPDSLAKRRPKTRRKPTRRLRSKAEVLIK